MCRVIFSEYYFKDHIGNKCTLVCFNVSSLVRLHACSLIVCRVFFVILLNKFNSIQFNPNLNSNSALTLIMTLNSH